MLSEKQVNYLICKAINEYNENGNSEEFDKTCTSILQHADVKQVIRFAQRVKGVDLKKFSDVVLHQGSVEQNFEFATIEGCDSRPHRQKIIESGNVEFNLRAGKQIKDDYRDIYINRHGAVVVNGSAYDNFKYLKNNNSQTLNKQPHFDKILTSGNAYINYTCAKEIKGADILAHGQVVIDSKDCVINLSFARIKGSDTAKHLEVVLRYGKPIDNFEVITQFNNCNMIRHLNKIFKSDDNETKYECVKWLEEQDLLKKFRGLPLINTFIQQVKKGEILIETQNF